MALTTRKHGTAEKQQQKIHYQCISSFSSWSCSELFPHLTELSLKLFLPTNVSHYSSSARVLTTLTIVTVVRWLMVIPFLRVAYAQIYLLKNKQAISRLAQNYTHNFPHTNTQLDKVRVTKKPSCSTYL